MTAYVVNYGLPLLTAVIAGAVAGGLTSWHLRGHRKAAEPESIETERDPFIEAEIDLASVRWAEANDQSPEAAGLMAERLKVLHKIGKRKGWA